MLDLIIRGGDVVTPEGVVRCDVAIQGETIAALTAPGTLADADNVRPDACLSIRFAGATLCGRPPSGAATPRRSARHLFGGSRAWLPRPPGRPHGVAPTKRSGASA